MWPIAYYWRTHTQLLIKTIDWTTPGFHAQRGDLAQITPLNDGSLAHDLGGPGRKHDFSLPHQ